MQPTKRIWKLLISMKLGVVLLILFAGLSIVGTFVPQESFAPEQVEQLHPIWRTLGFTDLYESVAYRVLVFFLVVNLLSCTLYRLSGILSSSRRLPEIKTVDQIVSMSVHTSLPLSAPLKDVRQNLEKELSYGHYRYQIEQTGESFAGWAQKNRFGVWGSLVVHVSFLVLLLGTVIGHAGFKGFYMTFEGASFPLRDIQLEQGQLKSDWDIRINSAREKFDAQGLRDNWYTDISILQNGKELKQEVLSVNHPVAYQGITFYQASFGDGVSLFATLQGQKIPFALQERGQTWFQAPGTSLYLLADSIGIENGRIVMTYQVLARDSSKPVQTGVIRQGEQADIQGLYNIALKGPVNFTGLVIKKDPGVPVIWLGSALLMLGLILSFYFKPQQVWFFVAGEGTEQSLSLSLWSAAGTEMAKELLQDFSQALEQGNLWESKRKDAPEEEEDWES